MAAIIQETPASFQSSIQAPTPITPTLTSGILPTIDLSSHNDQVNALDILSHAASSSGAALLTNLSIKPPIASIQRLFERLYSNPALAARVNATYPTRGVFKAACLDPASSPSIDQKTTIDLSIARLAKLRELDPELVEELGRDFELILEFYSLVESKILPLLLTATSHLSNTDLAPNHSKSNNNLRLIDYFPSPSTSAPRCGEHRDYGTFTIVFQDSSVGGLEFSVDDKWIQVPANVDAVVSWGWCGAILSNDNIKAAKHRVLKTEPIQKRRTTAVVFVAPDLDTVLKPVGQEGVGKWSEKILEGKLTVGAFKEVISKKWRRREGNEEGEVVEGAQDREVEAFVKGL